MAHTNSTPNYNLPQFLPTDKPAWLVDINPAYASIDTAIKNASDAASDAQADATQALSDAAGANAIATQANTKADGATASIAEQFLDTATYAAGEYVIFNNILYVCTEPVTTPGPWTGSVNWARASVDSIATALNNDVNELKDRTGSDINVSDSSTVKIANAIEDLTPFKIPDSSFTMNQGFTLISNESVRIGKMIFINLQISAAQPANDFTIGTIASEYRKGIAVNLFTANANYVSGSAWISYAGVIRLTTQSNTSGNINFMGNYLLP